MSILVTGATGNIGQHLVEKLMSSASQETVVAASTHGNSVAGASGRMLDFLNKASVQEAFRLVDSVFLLTPAHPEMETMTANAVAAARANGVKHLIRISGAGANAESDIAIARLQGRCDQLVVESGIPYTLLRPKNFMQNFATFMRDMIRSGTVYSSQGEGRVPFVDVRDIAEVAAKILLAPAAHTGKAYTLTGFEALTNAEAIRQIAVEIEHPVSLVHISEEQAVAGMRQFGMPEPLVLAMSSLNQVIAQGWAAEVSPDISQILGRPATRFVDFAHDYRQVWQQS